MKLKSITALLLASLLALSPLVALAEEYDIGEGSITVSHNGTAQTVSQNGSDHTEESATVVKGSSTSNTLTVNAPEGTKVEVTLKDVNIDVSGHEAAAVTTTGQGDVTIELDGNNTIKSGEIHAGLQKENGGNLTVQDSNDTAGSLSANGGEFGAGIGGGDEQSCSNITISDATVTANGGRTGAGIGGGSCGNGDNITITGSTVIATGGYGAAGIGGGDNWSGNSEKGDGTNITITDSTVIAQGGYGGAGIGGGSFGDASNIVISSSTVIAAGGEMGAGIGNGSEIQEESVTSIKITGDSNVSVAGGKAFSRYPDGAAIGHGGRFDESAPVEVEPDIDALCSNGSVSYYAAGTSAEAMQSGTAEPVKTDTGEKHVMTFVQGTEATCDTDGVLDHYHCSQCNKNYKDEAGKQVLSSVVIPKKGHDPKDPVIENEVQPTETKAGSYDEVVYCKVCGAEISRKTKTVPALEDAFTRFCKQVARQIRQAPEDGTVHVNGTVWSGLQRRVFEALHERPDVTVVITCKLDGKETELTIPAGADLLLSVGQAAVISYAEMDKLLG